MIYKTITIAAIIANSVAFPQQPEHLQNQQHPNPQTSGPTTPVSIVSQSEVVNGDGSFNYSYELSNGIRVEQDGYLKKAAESRSFDPNNPNNTESGDIQVVQGSFSYTAPDGQQYSVSYIADDNGFQPQGAHLPTAPPAPGAHSLNQDQQQGFGHQEHQFLQHQQGQHLGQQPLQNQPANLVQ